MNLLVTIFCKHKWKSHTKVEYTWTERVEGTWNDKQKVSETVEVLICQKCGKIHKITY